MRKAIIATLSIAVATIATSQADAKGKKTTTTSPKPFVFIHHYDKSSPTLLKQQTGSTTKPNTSGSSQKTGRK
jgi:type VI protein secretion system component Hcp